MNKNSKLLKSIVIYKNKKKLFIVFTLFFILLYLFLINVYLHLLGENYDYKQKNINFSLYGKKYSYEFEDLEFKLYLANEFKKNIILGSSTSMTFRPQLLNIDYFNSSKGNIKISEIDFFLKKLKFEPNHVIVFLDPYHFNLNFPEINKIKYSFINKIKYSLYSDNFILYHKLQQKILSLKKFNKIFIDLINNFDRYFLIKLESRNIGFNGKIFNSGFRVDGSFKYPDEYINNVYVKKNQNFNLENYSKKNLYLGKIKDFDNNIEKKLFFLTSKNENEKKKILIVLNVVESNFLKSIKSDNTFNKFLIKYKEICNYLIQNKIKCIDKTYFAIENNIDSNNFFDPFHFNDELSYSLLKDILKQIKNDF